MAVREMKDDLPGRPPAWAVRRVELPVVGAFDGQSQGRRRSGDLRDKRVAGGAVDRGRRVETPDRIGEISG
jgi:hypothetical protein